MASGIPTRRFARRVDENALPATSTIATRSRSANAAANTASNNGNNTTIPVMKRTGSTAGATTRSSTLTADTKSTLGKTTMTRRRAALGQGVERRPLQNTQTTQQTLRRTTRSIVTEPKDEKVPISKRKLPSTTRPTRPSGSRANSTTSTSTNTSDRGTRGARAIQPTTSLPEAGPATKRLRPSDVLQVADYDADVPELKVERIQRSPRPVAKDAGWTDLDAEDEGDPTMVSEYVIDAFNYMMELETTMADPDYMDRQDELQWKMRCILNDWIIEVHSKFRLLPETLLIATNLIDRFLSKRSVSLVKFQLVGLTALFVAAKYEEVICPSVTHFLHMTDGGYDVGEILRAERYLLTTLGFDLSFPNPLHFLRRVSKADGYDVHARTVAKYFIEISCVDHRLIAYPPSMLAAAAMWLARLCLERGPWHANMVHYSSYSQAELLPCAQVMLDFVLDPEVDLTSAFFKKYASKKHLKASVYVREWAMHRWPESAVPGHELEEEFGLDDQVPPPPPPSSE
ncbi:g2/mitotic-specific cyclin cdc13 [Trichosporon asahii var. asahii CBS 2479]|uniref:G2/mitotic-specific cyclin cdc13 n=1 Tax=Trichosporon asahii var. asahii (strain ATCC 90039 / CBS 2479 / JCM 2466 / KCTC 7840 / NBRC 103889/ NCYC 2677 / UAMH 7654) TaxID=1186058 RepID=J5Q6L6_TRIAS|nr:g2/mitotic-specific cyclin cdc13 [Trichosporon asahii var. asahii CBS 2479]EJT45753.1 g2/mitotic-specific cyclin cdc13 [Trichosporon asahii var. asahii CBS 2479]